MLQFFLLRRVNKFSACKGRGTRARLVLHVAHFIEMYVEGLDLKLEIKFPRKIFLKMRPYCKYPREMRLKCFICNFGVLKDIFYTRVKMLLNAQRVRAFQFGYAHGELTASPLRAHAELAAGKRSERLGVRRPRTWASTRSHAKIY